MDRLSVTRDIVEYLEQHVSAADTLEGVASWWLGLQTSDEVLRLVQWALETLAEQQVVEKNTLPEGTVIYAAGRKLRN